jgi:hypothetical protein
MLRKTTIVLATAAGLTGGFTADAVALGGNAYMSGLGGGPHLGSGFGINPRPWFTVPHSVPTPLPQPEYVRRRPWSTPPIPRFSSGRR